MMNPQTKTRSTEQENLAPQYTVHGVTRTMVCPDFHVLANNNQWTMTPEAHKYAAAARSYVFRYYENKEQ